MKVQAAFAAIALATSVPAFAAVPDPAEPPATPAGGTPIAGITAGTVIGVAILVGAVAALAGQTGDDSSVPPVATGTGSTGTGP